MYYWSGTNSCPTTYSLSVIIILNVGWLMWRLSLVSTNSIPAFSTLWAKFFTRPFLVWSEGSGAQTTPGIEWNPADLMNLVISASPTLIECAHYYIIKRIGDVRLSLCLCIFSPTREEWSILYVWTVHLLFYIPSTAYDVELLDDKVPCVGRCLLWFGTHCRCVFRASFSGHS